VNKATAIKRISGDLLRCGVRRGGVLLVHSSMSALGIVPAGPETVILGLLEALGPEGTLLIPSLSYEFVTPERPVFNVLLTPSNIGLIPEFFRTRRGSVRSWCPTHSVSGAGPAAKEILAEHHLDDTPCGPRSPFRKLRDCGGQILMLGCGLRPNTSMHGVEELVGPPYLFGETIEHAVTRPDGGKFTMRLRRHNFAGKRQRYDRLEQLLGRGELAAGRVLAAEAYVIECPAMWDKAEKALRADPLYFVEAADNA